jgi:hypothetical protein
MALWPKGQPRGFAVSQDHGGWRVDHPSAGQLIQQLQPV